MANPTTNYGFVLPTSTDLVTDLPADFDIALQGVDTRLKALQPGTTLGDLAYSSATANTNTRLPIGTNGQVLAVVAGVPAWQNGTTGDIEGVTAGTGISGGGTSGTVTITNSMATAIDAKGDLIAGTGADTFARLAVGTNDLVLSAASGEATGLKYAGAWTTWTPTHTNITIGNGTVTSKYAQIGKTVFFEYNLQFGSTTSITGGGPSFTLPVSAVSNNFFFNGNILDAGITNYAGASDVSAGGNTSYYKFVRSSGTYAQGESITSTAPMTWGTGDVFTVAGNYQVA
jgi:hypothetical protein